jgi:hypothetical protein
MELDIPGASGQRALALGPTTLIVQLHLATLVIGLLFL